MDINTQYARAWIAENVWSAPRSSSHYMFTPARLTTVTGALKRVNFARTSDDLPDREYRWHVYQVGGIDPLFFNLPYRGDEWINIVEVMNIKKMMVNVYATNGVELPRHDVYYKFTNNGNLIFALRINRNTKFNYVSDAFTVRVMTNEFWKTTESQDVENGFMAASMIADVSADVQNLIDSYTSMAALADDPIQIQTWHNGVRKDFADIDVRVGDIVDVVIDKSIYRKSVVKMDQLQVFTSTLDKRQKYLVHLPKPDNNVFPEMRMADMYVKHTSKPEQLYLHRSSSWAIRGLTHNDFSVAVSVASAATRTMASMFEVSSHPSGFEVIVLQRRSGNEHTVVLDASYMIELYKLDEDEIVDAMVGPNATIDFWRAASLEANGYNQLVYADNPCELTQQKIQDGMGYHALAKVLANSPIVVKNPGATGYVDLPFMLASKSTVYEYDENGLLLSWHHHYLGNQYFVKNINAHMVEVIAGLGGSAIDEVHGVANVQAHTFSSERNWRVYERTKVGNIYIGQTKDVTGTNKYTLSASGKIVWNSPDPTSYPTVRSDSRFLALDFNVTSSEGVIRIPINTHQSHGAGEVLLPIGIPLGQLDVMINGYSLINNLEYFYKDGELFIVSKEYLQYASNGIHKVHVRFAGLCRKDMSLWKEDDQGFIVHGKVSHNHRFNLRYGRVMRCVVNGRVKLLTDQLFTEDTSVLDPQNPLNGKPYSIKDHLVPLKPYVDTDAWAMMDKAIDNSDKVSDFLTIRNPQPDLTDLQTVQSKYRLFSPFFSRILYDVHNRRLSVSSKTTYTQQDVSTICKNYEYLLAVDPARQNIDARFVEVQPSVSLSAVSVQVNVYAFLEAVSRYYLYNRIALRDAVLINTI